MTIPHSRAAQAAYHDLLRLNLGETASEVVDIIKE